MPTYDIYMLDESDLSISGGGQLDGVTQGDGSHLVGLTMTINNPAWHAISINDNDPNFQDSDGSQRLNGAHTIDGVTYAGGTRVEAEYGITVTDGVNTWQLVGFNVRNSNPAFGTVEGIAVIGGPGGFPPAGVPLTIVSAQEGPNYPATGYATPVCFAADTRIAVPGGWRTAGEIEPGDMVRTRDHGARKVRWTAQRRVAALASFAPVEFAPGTIGNSRPLRLSQQHRVVVSGWRAELYFGAAEVLVPAKALVDGAQIRLCPGGLVTYVHLMFDTHEIVFAEGAPCESFQPGQVGLSGLDRGALDELRALFPEMDAWGSVFPPCLPSISARDAQVLAAPGR